MIVPDVGILLGLDGNFRPIGLSAHISTSNTLSNVPDAPYLPTPSHLDRELFEQHPTYIANSIQLLYTALVEA